MIRCPPSQVVTESPDATALPPDAMMSSTTPCAIEDEPPVPSSSAPMSLTTTLAPFAANSSATPRPIPRPAPVTTATFPSRCNMLLLSCSLWFANLFAVLFAALR